MRESMGLRRCVVAFERLVVVKRFVSALDARSWSSVCGWLYGYSL